METENWAFRSEAPSEQNGDFMLICSIYSKLCLILSCLTEEATFVYSCTASTSLPEDASNENVSFTIKSLLPSEQTDAEASIQPGLEMKNSMQEQTASKALRRAEQHGQGQTGQTGINQGHTGK